MGTFPRLFGPYVLLGELGSGGMGMVFQARHIALNRSVALKILRSDVASRPAALQRLQMEAEAVAALSHPHIVPVYEAGECDGQFYLSMKLVTGGTLAERLAEGPLSPDAAAAVLAKLAAAVEHAHQRGTLHRDLKPGNVLLDDVGDPFLADFGLAKFRDAALSLTGTQAVLGTPAYMAPEVATGGAKAATTAADLYSLGAMFYEMLVGRPPFVADTALATLHQADRGDLVPPRRINPSIPRDLELICLKCLRREPAQRYGTAAELAEDCRRFLDGEVITARQPSLLELLRYWLRRHRLAAGFAAALLASLVLGLGASLTQWRRAERHLRASETANTELRVNLAHRRQELAEPMLVSGQSLGGLRTLAQLLEEDPRNELARIRLQSALIDRQILWPVLPPLRHADVVTEGRFDPVGRWVLTASKDGRVHVWNVTNGVLEGSIPHRPAAGSFALSQDGGVLAVSPAPATIELRTLPGLELLARWSDAGDDCSALAFAPRDEQLATGHASGKVRIRAMPEGQPIAEIRLAGPVRLLCWSHDGQALLAAERPETVLWRPTTGERLALECGEDPIRCAEFSADSRRLLTVNGSRIRVWDAARGQLVRELTASAAISHAAFSPDGMTVGSANNAGRGRLQHVTNDSLAKSLLHDAPVHTIRFAPSGSMLLTASADCTARLWSFPLGRGIAQPLFHNLPVLDARFSPDERLILTSSADGTARLSSLIRQPMRELTVPMSAQAVAAGLDPTGRQLVVATTDDLVAFRLEDLSRPFWQVHLNDSASIITVDPAGRTLALASANGAVSIHDSATGRRLAGPFPHPEPIQRLRFSGDGHTLVATMPLRVQVWSLALETMRLLGTFRSQNPNAVAVSPNGRRLACVASPQTISLHRLDQTDQPAVSLTHPGPVSHVAFSPDSRWLVTGGLGYAARVWAANDGAAVTPWLATGFQTSCVQFSPDSRTLLVGALDGSARRFDAETGRSAGAPLMHAAPVTAAAFSPDGRWVATLDAAQRIRLCDVRSALVASNPLLAVQATDIAFTPDGQRLLVHSAQLSPIVWNLPLGDAVLPTEALLGLMELLTGEHGPSAGHATAHAATTVGTGGATAGLDPSALPPSYIRYQVPAETGGPPLGRRGQKLLEASKLAPTPAPSNADH